MEKETPKKKRDDFLEAKSWSEEKYDKAIRERRVGWMVAISMFAIAFFLAIALAALVPLEKVEPVIIKYDRMTGETHVVKPLKNGGLTQQEALTKYWIIKYVKARIGYDRQDVEKNYRVVRALTDKSEFRSYSEAFDPKKETSPYQVYGKDNTVKANIKSISFLDDNTATVRIDVIENFSRKNIVEPWVITLSFNYTLEPRSEKERFINPLGFQVTKWRKDKEVE